MRWRRGRGESCAPGGGSRPREARARARPAWPAAGKATVAPKSRAATWRHLFSPIEEVRQRLLQVFAGRTLTFDEIIQAEADTRFTDTAYRNALLELEHEQRVTVNPPADQRRFQPGGERRSLSGS